MFALLFALVLAVNLGPMGVDGAAHEPQLAVDGSRVVLAFGAGKGIYFSSSSDSGVTFSAPVRIAEGAIVPLTRHRGPRIAISGHTIVITAVTGKTTEDGPHAHGLPSDGDLIAWRSADGGKTWSKGVVINDVPSAPTEGLHALAADSKGGLFAAWLDKRGSGTKLYGARSTDGGATWSKNVMIYDSPDGSICQCCHPSIAIDSSGQILIMWRNALAGARDMYLVRSRDGIAFSKPEKLGMGTWRLNACPMDGGGIAIAQSGVVTAWRRDREIFLASPGAKEISIGEGVDVAIAAAEGGVAEVWSTPAGIRALLPGKTSAVEVSSKGAFPAVVGLANGRALAAWEDGGRIQISQIN